MDLIFKIIKSFVAHIVEVSFVPLRRGGAEEIFSRVIQVSSP
jgi:hypothetical protein